MNLLEAASLQVKTDVTLLAGSAQGKDDKIMLTHKLGLSRMPEDAHKELSSLGYSVVRTSRNTNQNIAPTGSTRQFSPKSTESWQYKHASGSKAEMKMSDSGGTAVMINGPRADHERFRQRMDMKPHPAFKKMDQEETDTDPKQRPQSQGRKAVTNQAKKGIKVEGAAEIISMQRNNLYAASEKDLGANELRNKLDKCLSDKFPPKKNPAGYMIGNGTWIQEVYPLDSYFIFTKDGDQFKQKFTVDDSRECKLDGAPQKVRVTYVNASTKPSKKKTSVHYHQLGLECNGECKTVKAGGPGSGRHPEFGKFQKQSSLHGTVNYKTAKGTTLQVRTTRTKASDVPSGKYRQLYEGKAGQDSRNHIISGDSSKVDPVLKSKYGITDHEDKSNKGAAQPKISRRSSEQKRRDNFVLYD